MTPLYPQKLALTSPTGGGRSVGIVRSLTKATEFSFYYTVFHIILSPTYFDPQGAIVKEINYKATCQLTSPMTLESATMRLSLYKDILFSCNSATQRWPWPPHS